MAVFTYDRIKTEKIPVDIVNFAALNGLVGGGAVSMD